MGIQACRTCGKEFERHGQRPYRYCEDHRLSERDRRACARAAFRDRHKKARVPVLCRACGIGFSAMRSDAKWCPPCKDEVIQQQAQRFEQRERHPCPGCGAEIARTSRQCRTCGSKAAGAKRSGPNNYAWKGGRSKDKWGYVLLLVAPEAPKGHRYQFEHRLVWEAANGPIPAGVIIHHRNGIKDDNRLENLEAMPRRKHNHRHDEHDRRIVELEAENRRLRDQLDGVLGSQIPVQP